MATAEMAGTLSVKLALVPEAAVAMEQMAVMEVLTPVVAEAVATAEMAGTEEPDKTVRDKQGALAVAVDMVRTETAVMEAHMLNMEAF